MTTRSSSLPTVNHIREWAAANRPLVKSLVFAQMMALVWWLAALWLRGMGVDAWHDQIYTFRETVHSMANPYAIVGFVNVPWIVPIIAPFALLPVELSMLIQSCLMFAILTLVIFRFKGDFWVVVWTLTSFMSLDSVLEMNVDWIVMIGLLVPVIYSAPFLLIKPQLVPGYYFAVPPKKWLLIAAFTLLVVLLSFVFWGFWIPDMIAGIRSNSMGRFFNIAPINLMPWPISVAIGGVMAYFAFRRRDEVLGIIAGFFFVPYFAPYSMPLLFAMVAIKARRLAIIIFFSMWIIYGGAVLMGILQR